MPGAGREHQAGLDELARSYTLGRQATEHSRAGDALRPPPPMPPETVEEEAFSREICEKLDTLIALQTERNLSRAVILAQQAARGVGPLVGHFPELGRRYAHLADAPPKPTLRVVKEGAS